MKHISYIFAVVMLSASSGCALPEMKTTFHVVDAETGMPVTNAIVQKSFVLDHDWAGTQTQEAKFNVNKEGVSTFSGKTHIIAGGGASVVADGYYSGGGSSKFTGCNRLLNRWEPWNPTIEVRMRSIKNPEPLVHYFHGGNWMRIPEPDKPIGFDLEVFDWVAPYGKGKITDFIFTAYRRESKDGVKSGYELTFSNPQDGIQEFIPSDDKQSSSFIFPYMAPENGYSNALKKYKNNPNYAAIEQSYKDSKDINYIFRVRSQTDKSGKIISACYGRIKGEITMSGKFGLQFECWFNPVPNERSLEWNGVNLLKK